MPILTDHPELDYRRTVEIAPLVIAGRRGSRAWLGISSQVISGNHPIASPDIEG